MIKRNLFISLLFAASSLFAQQSDSTLVGQIQDLKSQVEQQQKDIERLYSELSKEYRTYKIVKEDLNQSIIDNKKQVVDSLNTLIQEGKSELSAVNAELSSQIESSTQKTDTQIAKLDGDVVTYRLYWIIATLVTLLLGVLIYFLLGKRIRSSKTDVETQIRNTKASLEEESVKLDNKLVDVLETQLKLKQEETKSQPIASNQEADHSLALKVADEIVRMQKNISRMDNETKGLKPLGKGIERIKANFAANGYDMVNLLDKDYEDRMNLDVINFIEDDELQEGKKIITRIIKPQVNYDGKLIQRAQVEVSQN